MSKGLFILLSVTIIISTTFIYSCTKGDNPKPDINNQDSVVIKPLQGYYIDKVIAGPSTVNHFFYYDSSNRLSSIANQYQFIKSMSFFYNSDNKVSKVLYSFDNDRGPYKNGSDSIIYKNGKIYLTYKRRDAYLDIDTFTYNNSDQLISIASGKDERIYRSNFYYNTNFNIVKYTFTRYCYTQYEEKIREVNYGNYDTLVNPFHNLAGEYFIIPDIYDYSGNNLDGEDYTQLSKNNPGHISDYQTGFGGTFLNGSSNLIYELDSAGKRPIKMTDGYSVLQGFHYFLK